MEMEVLLSTLYAAATGFGSKERKFERIDEIMTEERESGRYSKDEYRAAECMAVAFVKNGCVASPTEIYEDPEGLWIVMGVNGDFCTVRKFAEPSDENEYLVPIWEATYFLKLSIIEYI